MATRDDWPWYRVRTGRGEQTLSIEAPDETNALAMAARLSGYSVETVEADDETPELANVARCAGYSVEKVESYILIAGERVSVSTVGEHGAASIALRDTGAKFATIYERDGATPNTVEASEPHAACPCCVPKRAAVCVSVDREGGGRQTRLVVVAVQPSRESTRELARVEAERLGYRNVIAF